VIGGTIVLKKLSAIGAPQLPAREAPGDADIIDIRVVLAITCLRAATLGAVTHHDSIDKLLATSAFLESAAKFVDHVRAHASQSTPRGCLFVLCRFRYYFSLTVWTALCPIWDLLLATPADHD
jgi:hypothetical protein